MDISLGTPYYMAPELVEQRTYDERVDVWSLGCIVYVLLSGKLPFSGKKIDDIADAILTKEVDFDPKYFADVSYQAKRFISVCLTKKYEERPHVSDLFKHPWIKKWVEDPVINETTKLQIYDNLHSFHKASLLQSGVMSLMSNLMASNEDLQDYITIFQTIDKSHDGFLSYSELKRGLMQLTEEFNNTSEDDWEEILAAMDTNQDG